MSGDVINSTTMELNSTHPLRSIIIPSACGSLGGTCDGGKNCPLASRAVLSGRRNPSWSYSSGYNKPRIFPASTDLMALYTAATCLLSMCRLLREVSRLGSQDVATCQSGMRKAKDRSIERSFAWRIPSRHFEPYSTFLA